MLYLFRAALYLTAYATLLGAPLYFLLRVLFDSPSAPVVVAGVMTAAAVIDKTKRHGLLQRVTWQGRGILDGEVLLVIVVAIIALLQYLFPDGIGILLMLWVVAYLYPEGLLMFAGFLALWVAGVMMVPRELHRSIDRPHAT